MLSPANIQLVIRELDDALAAVGEKRTLVVCGGGALIVADVIDRVTRDIDVITPELDPLLKDLAATVGKRHGLEKSWLNNGPASLTRDLESGWRKRTELLYEGGALIIEVLGRSDLLASKLFAFCDRDEQDLDDLLRMAPAWSEVEVLQDWLLARDGSLYWPNRVNTQLALLKRKLGYE